MTDFYDFTMTDFYDFNIPVWAVCFMCYGEVGDLNDIDVKDITNFLESLPPNGTWDFGNETFFSNNPAFGLAGECIKARYWEA
jgi:hypothetical protein